MSIPSTGADLGLIFVVAGLLGALLSTVSEVIIASFLPRLGALPRTKTRLTTAALTGALCGALSLQIGLGWPLPAFVVLGVLSVQLARIDLTHHLLPNPLVLALLIAGIALLVMSSAVSGKWTSLTRAIVGAIALFLVYVVLALISPGGIGMGDVKLAAPLGLYLGYLGWAQLFYGGALGFVLGGLAAAFLSATKRVARGGEVAFGPSMLAAALGTVLYST